jgi:hypothetical protein
MRSRAVHTATLHVSQPGEGVCKHYPVDPGTPICSYSESKAGPDPDPAIGRPAKHGWNAGREGENRRVELARLCTKVQFVVLKLYSIWQKYNSHVIYLSS